jgi:hypothetical protein
MVRIRTEMLWAPGYHVPLTSKIERSTEDWGA